MDDAHPEVSEAAIIRWYQHGPAFSELNLLEGGRASVRSPKSNSKRHGSSDTAAIPSLTLDHDAAAVSKLLVKMHKRLRHKIQSHAEMERFVKRLDRDGNGRLSALELVLLTRGLSKDNTLTATSPVQMELWRGLRAIDTSQKGGRDDIQMDTLLWWWSTGPQFKTVAPHHGPG